MLFGVLGDTGDSTGGGSGVPDPLEGGAEGDDVDGEALGLALGGGEDELLGGVFGEHDCVGGQ